MKKLCANSDIIQGKTKIKTYSELITIQDYADRYRYLKIGGKAGEETFGTERYLNQILYKSREWKEFRREMILRDSLYFRDCCDMACSEVPINGIIILHHLNPITPEDILQRRSCVFDPDNVVCVADSTHKAIHYGDETLLMRSSFVERKPGDTTLWR